jgi:hypothetical protein
MGDYNNPFENNNNQSSSSDPKLPENGQQPYHQQGTNEQQNASNQDGYQQFGQNPYQNSQDQNQNQNNPYQQNQYQNNQNQNNPYQNNQYQNHSYQQNAPVQNQSNGMAIGSLVCGIIGLLLSCCWYIGIPLSIAGLVLGILVLKNKKGGKGMAIAGIVLSSITIVIGIFAVIMFFAFSTSPEFSNLYEEIYSEIQSTY